MKSFKSAILVVLFLVLTLVAASNHLYAEPALGPKGVILLIGDGMGINQIRSAAIYARDVLGRSLAIDSIMIRGTTTTHSANSEVTDSAAASTALHSGQKANNNALNILPDGRRVYGIGHAAKKAGLSVGVVSTTRLTHATPAGVYAGVTRRNEENLIATQLVDFSPEVAMAGGMRHFMPIDQTGSQRKDNRDLIEEMKNRGYRYVTEKAQLSMVDAQTTGRLLGLFTSSHMAYELDRLNVPELGKQPSLAEMTKVALDILGQNPKGFFVMIEGGRIDHACHAHDIMASIYDTLAFDDAVKIALEYREAHPDFLVLVAADHETGGLGLGREINYSLNLKALEPIKLSMEYLRESIIKHPAKLDGILKIGGFDLNDKERAFLKRKPYEAKLSSLPQQSGYGAKINKYVLPWGDYALSVIESDRAQIGWTSFAHTAQPVITYAIGPGEGEFRGSYDNTDIAKKTAKLLGLVLEPPVTGPDTQGLTSSSRHR